MFLPFLKDVVFGSLKMLSHRMSISQAEKYNATSPMWHILPSKQNPLLSSCLHVEKVSLAVLGANVSIPL